MKTSGKVIVLLSHFLFICTAAHSGLSKEEQLHSFNHYNNASLVEDGLKLVSSSSGLVISTAISYGFWYGLCKSIGVVSALAGGSGLSVTEENQLQEVKSSFCNQLAAVITSTEVALAGQLSTWPLQQHWWKPLRFVGTGFAGFKAYTTDDSYFTPITAIAYFTHELAARTAAGAHTIKALRSHDTGSIQPEDFVSSEYDTLKSMAGLIVGSVAYRKTLKRGYSALEGILAYLLSALLTKSILTGFFLASHSDGVHAVEVEAEAKTLAGAGALAEALAVALGAAALVGSIVISVAAVRDEDRAIGAIASGSFDPVLFIATVGTLASCSLAEVESLSGVKSEVLSGALCGMAVGAGVMILLMKQNSNLDSNHLSRNIALTLAPALALALIHGVSNNAVSGYSLEESFTETAHSQWKKFHAPLDYLYTLFH